MHAFIVILAMLASVLLCAVVLLQSPKAGSGLTGGVSSLGTVQTLGVRRTGDFLSKTTAILAALVMVLCFIAQFTLPNREQRVEAEPVRKQEAAPLPVNNLPQELPAAGSAPAPTTPAAPAK